MPTVRTRPPGQVPTPPLPRVRRGLNPGYPRVPEPEPMPSEAPAILAKGGLARTVSGIAGEAGAAIAAAIQKAKKEADDLRARRHARMLNEEIDTLLYAPETGLMNRKGYAVLGAEEKFWEAFEATRGKFAEPLTPEQRRIYDELTAEFELRTRRDVLKYTSGELDEADIDELTAQIGNAHRNAMRHVGDVEAFDAYLGEAEGHLKRLGRRRGWSGAQYEEERAKLTSLFFGQQVETLMASNPLAAQFAYNQHKDEISPERREAIETKLKPAVTMRKGVVAAEEIWNAAGPKTDASPASIDVLLEAARRVAGADDALYEATAKVLKERADAFNAGVAQREAAYTSTVVKAMLAGAIVPDIVQMPEFQRLDGATQRQLLNWQADDLHQAKQRARQDLDFLWQQEQRARTREEQREQDKVQQNFIAYARYSHPDVLSQMTEEQILALAPTLGLTLTQQLLEDRRKLDSGAKIAKATVDAELLKQEMHQAGLKPYATGLTDTDKARLGAAEVAVKKAVAKEETARKRELTLEEQRKVIQQTLDPLVMLDRPGRDVSIRGAAATAEDRRKIYIPIADVPAGYQTEAANFLRSIGAAPQNAANDAVIRQHQRRIERAYALRVTGGSRQEIEAALRGQ